jgi:hypothetical protein
MTTTFNQEAPTSQHTTLTPAGTQTLSIVSLVLGLSSIFFGLTFILPIAAVVVGILALRREPAGKTMAIWGIATGGVMLAGVFLVSVIGLAFLAPFSALLFSGVFW